MWFYAMWLGGFMFGYFAQDTVRNWRTRRSRTRIAASETPKWAPPSGYVRCPNGCGRYTREETGRCHSCIYRHQPAWIDRTVRGNDVLPPLDALPVCRAGGEPVYIEPRPSGCCAYHDALIKEEIAAALTPRFDALERLAQ